MRPISSTQDRVVLEVVEPKMPYGGGLRLQKGMCWCRQKAGSHSARHVENKDPVPLVAQLPPDREQGIHSLLTARPGRDACADQADLRMPIIAQAVIKAWTTSVDPPSNANAADRGENEPGQTIPAARQELDDRD
jgi:hypothetical protein